MDFKEKLQQLVDSIPGVRGAAIMGVDGIPLELVTKDPEVDLELLGAEYAVIYKDAQRAAADLESGLTRQLLLKTPKGMVIFGGVNQDYFVMVLLVEGGVSGRARFLLQQALPQLRLEL